MPYTTEILKTDNLPAVPRNTARKSADQIVDYLMKHPESKTAKLVKAVFDNAHDPAHWKNPFYVRIVPSAYKEFLKAAIIFYLADTPYDTMYGVGSRGYQAW